MRWMSYLRATPQGLCASLIDEEILSKVKVIDLSADFRIKDVETYEKWYGIEHKSPQFIEEAVYGLCEINREEVKTCKTCGKSGMLSDMLNAVSLSARKRRTD